MLLGTLGQYVLGQFPGVVAPSPPPTPPILVPLVRSLAYDGVVVVCDFVTKTSYGTEPFVGQAFALVINTASGLNLALPITLHFISPTGLTQSSNPGNVFIGPQTLLQAEQVNRTQYVVYRAGINEFNEAGTWQVVVQAPIAQSTVYFFTIVPL